MTLREQSTSSSAMGWKSWRKSRAGTSKGSTCGLTLRVRWDQCFGPKGWGLGIADGDLERWGGGGVAALLCAARPNLGHEPDAGATHTGVEQDDGELLGAGVASLRGYITLCDAILIPAPGVPEGAAHTVDIVPGG